MYKKITKETTTEKRERDALTLWLNEDVFERSIAAREGAETFTFYDGPPTANGLPHIGHVLTRAVKDLIPRYKTMKGYKVLRKAGWDTHGLPVEREIEKRLGFSGKDDIERYGVEAFIKECKESVWKYADLWKKMSERVGYWADMDAPYVTYHNEYIESVWWALRQIWDKGLINKGHRIVPYCPRCGTPLSSHEVAQGYKDVKEKSVYAKFKVKNAENEFILAWTTTPWTLPSNVALVVNAAETYVKARRAGDDCVYIMAEALVPAVFGEDAVILSKMTGADLEFTEYEPLFGYAMSEYGGKRGHIVICDPYVTLTDGTGVVHCAPAFGEDDYRIGQKYDLPFTQFVDEAGKFKAEVVDFAGMFVKDADKHIIKFMRENGSLFKAEDYEHSYPHCWRCDTPLIYYARDAWYIAMSKLRENLLKNNAEVNWLPETIGTGRFGNWLENVIDWGFSRERYWGTPLPIWECGCGHRHMVGSVAELREMSVGEYSLDDLHKPYIDAVKLRCGKCGGEMTRASEVIDCWFDAGSMPFAQWHYPFENADLFNDNFPADFISEAIDQTRGWFYTLMAISTAIFDKTPYKNVVVLGHVADKFGRKMSKHLGNGIDPIEALDTHGADAVRWFFYINGSPWLANKYNDEYVKEYANKFLGTLWNSYAFYILYAEIDRFNPYDYTFDKSNLREMDRWALSRLNSTIAAVDENLSNYDIYGAAKALNDFVDELSNWYLRRSRERFWAGGMEQDKIDAYMTLFTVLSELVKLIAPFTPFIAEEIYQNIVRSVNGKAAVSVHLSDFPVADNGLIDENLERDMGLTLKVVTLGRAVRASANVKNRQPLSKLYISGTGVERTIADVVAEELNIKTVEVAEDTERFAEYMFKPQLRTLGRKYGKLVPAIGAYLKSIENGGEFLRRLKDGVVTFEVEGETVELSEGDILVETGRKEGYVSESESGVTVVLDVSLTAELVEEGYMREIVSKVQTMRKEAGFEVMDKIRVYYDAEPEIRDVFGKTGEMIKSEVLAVEIKEGRGGYSKDWDINGKTATLGVERV